MNTVEDYIALWKDYGLNSVSDYNKLCRELYTNEEFCDKFKNMNYRNFWKASHQMFGTDPIANHDNKLNKIDLEFIENANANNWNMAKYCGVAGYMDLFFENCRVRNMYDHNPVEIAEIGSGYGSFLNYLSTKDPDIYNYTGFDLISRFDDVVEVEGEDGCLSDEQVDEYENKFHMVYSFNVFQHLEKHQIEKYINQSYKLLNKNEYSSMILGICLNSMSFHYGQKIVLPTYDEFNGYIKGKFKPATCFQSYSHQHINMHIFHLDLIR